MIPEYLSRINIAKQGSAILPEADPDQVLEMLRKIFPQSIPGHLVAPVLFSLHGGLHLTARMTSLMISAYTDNIHENCEMDFYTECQIVLQNCLEIPNAHIEELKELFNKNGFLFVAEAIDAAIAEVVKNSQ